VGGTRHLLVPTEAPIDGLAPDMGQVALLLKGLRATGLAPVRRLGDDTLHTRVFVPGNGMPEDPGTGSAAGPLGMLCRELWGTAASVTIRQGAEMGRPCLIEVHAAPGEVRVGGKVAACAEGRFTL
jgi:trans-2,3-dihydro-3-hydroxyanthranilate isomerase